MKHYISPIAKSIKLDTAQLLANSDVVTVDDYADETTKYSNRRNSANKTIWGEDFYINPFDR